MTATEIELPHSMGTCRIHVTEDLLAEPWALLDALPRSSRVFLITDPNVAAIWADRLESALAQGGLDVNRVVLPAGEENKNLATIEAGLDALLEGGVRRDDRILALGGGVLGDEAGLLAALALRGIRWHVIPTTLLAMVDASVGGKVGVDHRTGKNRIGAFHQPESVHVSPSFLETLPLREVRAGLQEVVKSALLAGPDAVTRLANVLPGVDRSSIEMAVNLKAAVVAADEREGGRRRVLNLGHTLAHALEAQTGFRRFLHGEAVGWGLLLALRLSTLTDRLDPGMERDLAALVNQVGPRPDAADVPFDELVGWMKEDKKSSRAEGLSWILVEAPGRPVVVNDVSFGLVERAWEQVLEETRL